MAYGLSVAGLANVILEHLRGGTAWTKPTALYAQLHTGNPGASGTTAVSSVSTRNTVTFGAASNAAIALTGTAPVWNMTGTETISGISVWSAATAGTFLWSAALSASKTVANGDTLTLQSCGLAFNTLAS